MCIIYLGERKGREQGEMKASALLTGSGSLAH